MERMHEVMENGEVIHINPKQGGMAHDTGI